MLRALPSSAWCRRVMSAMSAAGLRSQATPRDVGLPWHQNDGPDQLGLRPYGTSCVHACALVSFV